MTVRVVDGQLKVTLTETETVKFNIDRVFFDRICEPAKMALTKLLRLAVIKTDFKCSATVFQIELYPVFEGGCEVWFIPQNTSSEVKPKATVQKCCIFEFFCSEGLLAACEALYHDTKTRYCRSAVYSKNGSYRLAVSGIDPSAFRSISLNFSDRTVSSAAFAAETAEHWKCICPKNAVAVIGAALSHTDPESLS